MSTPPAPTLPAACRLPDSPPNIQILQETQLDLCAAPGYIYGFYVLADFRERITSRPQNLGTHVPDVFPTAGRLTEKERHMVLVRFFPKEFSFFDVFDEHVGLAVEASQLFRELVERSAVDEIALARMQSIEHSADETTHMLIDQLNKTFITPFDREDIYSLAKELDDIVDTLTTIVNRMRVYRLAGPNKNLIEFSLVIDESIRAVASAVKGLRHMKNRKAITKCCVEVNTLENVGDSMRDKVLAELFETESNPINVIKWKEIYENAENVLDICEDVANVVESIVVKQA